MSKHSARSARAARSGRAGRPGHSVRRAPVLLFIGGALVIGGLADRAGSAHSAPAAGTASVQPVPVAAPVGAYSSSWFCAGATGDRGGVAPGQVLVANSGTAPVTGEVTLVGTAGGPRSVPLTVAPHATASVAETAGAPSPWVGAIVDVDGGGVAVSQAVGGPLGMSVSPCATSGSQHWYFPTGQTRVNADEILLMLNPYPTASIVDLSFSTDQGIEAPQDYQGLDIPPNGLVAVPLRSHLRRRASIAATVSARTGNVVAWETQIVAPPAKGAVLAGTPAANAPLADPAAPDAGVAVTLGAPSAATSWAWPNGLSGAGLDEQYVIYNPGPNTASVRLALGLAHGSAEPFDLTVGPFQAVPIVSEQQARIPGGLPHTATVVSTNGVPVVATRTVAAAGVAVGGVTYAGIGQMLGERLAAPDWLVVPAASDSHHVGSLIIENPGSGPVRVQVTGLPTGTTTVPVAAGGHAAVAVPPGSNGPVAVTAPAPLYVEYDVYGSAGTPGYSISSAVPFG